MSRRRLAVTGAGIPTLLEMENTTNHELNRLRTLKEYEILDSAPEECFDDLAVLAAQICGTSEAGVTLVDRDRLWFKSKVGFDQPEIPRTGTFCEYSIGQSGLLVVEDSHADPRFSSNPWAVGPSAYRFYASVPLVNPEGYALGTLFVLDKLPRTLDERQRIGLTALAKQAEAQLELRRKVKTLEHIIDQLEDYSHELLNSQERYRSVVDNIQEVIYQTDIDGRWLFLNPAWTDLSGYDVGETLGEEAMNFIHPDDRPLFEAILAPLPLADADDWRFDFRVLTRGGGVRWVENFVRVTHGPKGEVTGTAGTLNDITERRIAEESLKREKDYVSILQSATAAANEAESVGEALQKCLVSICDSMNWQIGHVYRVVDKEILRSTDIWHLENPDHYASFVDETGESRFASDDGLTGQTFWSKKAVWKSSIVDEPWCFRKNSATALGIRSGFAFPVTVGDEVTAVLEFFSVNPIEPDEKFLEVLQNVGVQLGRIVERKRAEDESRRLLSELADINLALDASTIVAVTDRDGTITHVNQKFCDISGYTKRQLVGANHRIISSGLHPKMFFDDMWNTLHLGQIWHGEIRNRAKNGYYYWVDSTIIPFLDDAGQPYQHISISIDITKRKVAEEALRESEGRFRAITETSPLGVFMIDPERRFVYVNNRLQQMTGWSRVELLGSDWTMLVEPDEMKRLAPSWRASRMRYFNEQFRLVMKDKTVMWANVNSAPIKINGHVVGYVGLVEDITDRKTMEQALRESENRYRVVAETASDAIITIDAESRIDFVNSGAEHIFGYSKEELEGELLTKLMPPALHQKHLESQARYIESGVKNISWRGMELPAIRKDGAEIVIEASFGEFKKDGKHSFTGIIRDITERKRIAAELQQAKEDAEAATRVKSQFLANMSHEIRTPMNSIIGLTTLLLEGDLQEDQRDLMSTVNSSAETLLTLINDILDFSKIEAGKLSLEEIDFDLHACVRDVFNLFNQNSLRGSNQLSFTLAPELPSYLRGDPVRLRQILTNLVGNAIKFTTNGEIKIKVELRRQQESSVVAYFEVEDSGVGVTEEQRVNLFKAFSQADGSINRRFGGTGLGLAICKELTELMGGKIGCISAPGKGSRFWFTAEFATTNVPSGIDNGRNAVQSPVLVGQNDSIEFKSGSDERKTLRILVADDNAVNRKVALLMLEKLGYEADFVCDGRQVLKAVAEKEYDVLLMDVQMPEMDGIETTRRICAERPRERRPRIIAMTANAMNGDREQCMEAGMDYYLSKPIRKQDLLAVLERCGTIYYDPADDPQAIETAEPAIVDFSMFQSLEEFSPGSADEIIAELIGIFLEESPRGLETLRLAVADRDIARIERAAHALKGSCATIGAAKTAKTCAELEKAAFDGDLGGADELVERVATELEMAARVLESTMTTK